MNFVWMILVGFVVGLIARFLMPGRDAMGFIKTTLLGIVGALVAGFLGQALGLYGPDQPAGIVASVIGALLVLFIYNKVSRRA